VKAKVISIITGNEVWTYNHQAVKDAIYAQHPDAAAADRLRDLAQVEAARRTINSGEMAAVNNTLLQLSGAVERIFAMLTPEKESRRKGMVRAANVLMDSDGQMRQDTLAVAAAAAAAGRGRSSGSGRGGGQQRLGVVVSRQPVRSASVPMPPMASHEGEEEEEEGEEEEGEEEEEEEDRQVSEYEDDNTNQHGELETAEVDEKAVVEEDDLTQEAEMEMDMEVEEAAAAEAADKAEKQSSQRGLLVTKPRKALGDITNTRRSSTAVSVKQPLHATGRIKQLQKTNRPFATKPAASSSSSSDISSSSSSSSPSLSLSAADRSPDTTHDGALASSLFLGTTEPDSALGAAASGKRRGGRPSGRLDTVPRKKRGRSTAAERRSEQQQAAAVAAAAAATQEEEEEEEEKEEVVEQQAVVETRPKRQSKGRGK